jgi:very-short-patch-repair endonuclease
MEHDIETNALLRSSGWKALRFWEHEVTENIDNVGLQILVALRKSAPARNKGYRR